MVNPCYQYLRSAPWARINSGAILLLSGEELDPLPCSIFSLFLKMKRCNYPIQLSVNLLFFFFPTIPRPDGQSKLVWTWRIESF